MTKPIEITGKSWLMVAALGLAWGGTFMVMALALRGISPFWLAAGRIGFATILLSAVWGGRGFRLFASRPKHRDLVALALLGALSTAVPFMLLSWGQQYVTSDFTGVSMAGVALIVLPLSHFFIPGEKMTARRTIGMLIGFCGVYILIGRDAFSASGDPMESAGRGAIFLATVCYGVSSVLVRRLPPIDPVGLSAALLLFGCALVVPAALVVEGLPPVVDRETLFWVALLGLIPTAAANLLRVVVIRQSGPVFMSIVNYMVPVWSVIFGATILSEDFPSGLFFALFLITSGVALSQFGALRRLFTGGTP